MRDTKNRFHSFLQTIAWREREQKAIDTASIARICRAACQVSAAIHNTSSHSQAQSSKSLNHNGPPTSRLLRSTKPVPDRVAILCVHGLSTWGPVCITPYRSDNDNNSMLARTTRTHDARHHDTSHNDGVSYQALTTADARLHSVVGSSIA